MRKFDEDRCVYNDNRKCNWTKKPGETFAIGEEVYLSGSNPQKHFTIKPMHKLFAVPTVVPAHELRNYDRNPIKRVLLEDRPYFERKTPDTLTDPYNLRVGDVVVILRGHPILHGKVTHDQSYRGHFATVKSLFRRENMCHKFAHSDRNAPEVGEYCVWGTLNIEAGMFGEKPVDTVLNLSLWQVGLVRPTKG